MLQKSRNEQSYVKGGNAGRKTICKAKLLCLKNFLASPQLGQCVLHFLMRGLDHSAHEQVAAAADDFSDGN